MTTLLPLTNGHLQVAIISALCKRSFKTVLIQVQIYTSLMRYFRLIFFLFCPLITSLLRQISTSLLKNIHKILTCMRLIDPPIMTSFSR